MNLRNLVPLAAISTLLLAAVAPTAVYATPATARAIVAQNVKPLPREQNDERTTACTRDKGAYLRLQKIQGELTRLQLAFGPTDDIRPKLDAMITQTNDLITTTRIRGDRCPAQR